MRALITGAAGGLGQAFAHQYAARGYDLILVDRDQDALVSLQSSVERVHRIGVASRVVDLSDRDDVARLHAEIALDDQVDVLVNNVGFMMGGSFVEHDPARLTMMIDMHVGASVTLCHAVLPAMVARKRGSIINVASLGAFEPSAADVLYGSTKQFLVHFSLALQGQVRSAGVRVQALCPGLTRTKFHDGSEEGAAIRGMFPRQLWMSPEDVVAASMQALDGREVVCIPGFKNRLLRVLMKQPRVLGPVISVLHRLA